MLLYCSFPRMTLQMESCQLRCNNNKSTLFLGKLEFPYLHSSESSSIMRLVEYEDNIMSCLDMDLNPHSPVHQWCVLLLRYEGRDELFIKQNEELLLLIYLTHYF